ncbi:MAG: CBS domain-containing protein [Cyclobacteriaceae bacterium]|jgi:CBS domain-containing protein|nr:CBS domain-containing protein [Cyclobacteriaceae bacterium]
MKKREKISSIMTKNVLTVDIDDSLKKVSDLFNAKKIRHLPVLSYGALVGMISHTDMLRISFGNTFGEDQIAADVAIFDMLSINQVMKHSPVSVSADQTITEAAEILSDREFHALPVVQEKELVGIITTKDLIKYYIYQN